MSEILLNLFIFDNSVSNVHVKKNIFFQCALCSVIPAQRELKHVIVSASNARVTKKKNSNNFSTNLELINGRYWTCQVFPYMYVHAMFSLPTFPQNREREQAGVV
jgi:hypothetical protein